jgi:hypothetical protein
MVQTSPTHRGEQITYGVPNPEFSIRSVSKERETAILNSIHTAVLSLKVERNISDRKARSVPYTPVIEERREIGCHLPGITACRALCEASWLR